MGSPGSQQHGQTHLAHRDSSSRARLPLAHQDPTSRVRLPWLTRIPAARPDSLGSPGSQQNGQTHLVHLDPSSTARLTWFTWIPAARPDSLGSPGNCTGHSQQSSSGLVKSAVLKSDADHWPGFFLPISIAALHPSGSSLGGPMWRIF
jgi:hypothetical protein